MIALARENLARAEITDPIRLALADAGYATEANLSAADASGPLLLVECAKESRQTGRAPTPQRPAGPANVPRTATAAMRARLATPAGHELYKRRGATIEPTIGQLINRLGRRLPRRGVTAAAAELAFAATTHNLLKIATATP